MMVASAAPSAPTIICVLCPAGAKRGAFFSALVSSIRSRVAAIVFLIDDARFSGANRVSPPSVGNSTLIETRSA